MDNLIKKPQAIEYKIFADDRGIFAPFLDDLSKMAQHIGLIQRIYYVVNHTRGVIRGFHYHEKEWKFFAIVNGAAKFIILNPTKPKETYIFTGSSRKNNLIIVPPGFANGWMSLEDNTILLCASNLSTKESLKDDQRFDPYKWGDLWTIKAR